jgi:hypothetical protein
MDGYLPTADRRVSLGRTSGGLPVLQAGEAALWPPRTGQIGEALQKKGTVMEIIRKGVAALERLSMRTLMIVLAVLVGIGLIPTLIMSGIFA